MRPISITILAWLYIAMGVIGFIAHAIDLAQRRQFGREAFEIEITETAAAVSGFFLLRRQNWARWLALAWIAFHVVLSFTDPLSKLLMHAALCIVIAYILFRRPANAYFRGR